MNNISIFSLLLSFVFVVSCHAKDEQESELPNVSPEQHLAEYLFTKFDDFQITKIYTKNPNKPELYRRALSKALVDSADNVLYEENYFKAIPGDYQSHMGSAVFIYKNSDDAASAQKLVPPKGFFETTKILTPYVIFRQNHMLYLAYTESAADKLALGYFDFLKTRLTQ